MSNYIQYGVKDTNDGRFMIVYREGRVDSYWATENTLEDAIRRAKAMNFGKDPFVELRNNKR